MSDSAWNDRIQAFWELADDHEPEAMLSAMAALVAERPTGDADALYEWASVHDFLGREGEAVPLYRAALGAGLGGPRRTQAVIQLASSLRNAGEPEAAVELLRDLKTDPAAQAFLALALHDAGRASEALAVALEALVPTLETYQRSLGAYAGDLQRRRVSDRRAFPVLYAADVQAAAAFWETLGFRRHVQLPPENPGYIGLRRDGSGELAVTAREWAERYGTADAGTTASAEMYVYVDDLDTTLAELRDAGVTVLRDPEEMGWGERIATVADADGHPVSLCQLPS